MLGKFAFSRIVPVVVSTALSTKLSVPVLDGARPRRPAPPGPPASRSRCFWMSARFAAGTANRTRIGRIWLIVTSGWASLARTRFPSRTRRLPVRPAIGARIVAYWRLSLASVTAAWLPAERRSRGGRGGARQVVLLRGDVLLLGQLGVSLHLRLRVLRLRAVALEQRLGLRRARPGTAADRSGRAPAPSARPGPR